MKVADDLTQLPGFCNQPAERRAQSRTSGMAESPAWKMRDAQRARGKGDRP